MKAPEEFIALVRDSPSRFWSHYTAIHFTEELREGFSDRQCDYFRYLADSGEHVAMDVTRCHFKIAALAELAPEAVLVHLHRPPASAVTSHMLPSDSGARGRLRRRVRQHRFWERSDKYDNWQFESIVGNSPDSPFGLRLREAGLDPEKIYRLPAVARLLAYWRVNYEQAERAGREHFGERFVSQRFDDFCRDPRGQVSSIYRTMGWSMPDLQFGSVRPPNGPFEPESRRWCEFGESVGLTEVHGIAKP